MSQRAAPQDLRGRRPVALIGLVLAVAVIAGTAWWLAGGLRVQPVTVPAELREDAPDAIAERGPQAFAVVRAESLSPDVIGLVEAITNQSAALPGVLDVESVTSVGVLTTGPSGDLLATPALGSGSELDPALSLEARVQRASSSLLGTAGLLTSDGRTLLVAAELDPTRSDDERADAARAFRDQATLAASVSGLPVSVSFGGEALTTAEATDDVRGDLALLVGLACVAPAAIALVVLRRRVPTGALLAAGGAALLLASVLVSGEPARGNASPLDPDHPVTVANDLVDQQLRGTIPVTIDVVGPPGAFRRPDVLARMDALSTWLRDEYGITAVDLPTTLRTEAGTIAGVDSVPSNPDDIATLLAQTGSFQDGAFLADIANDDLSRTRIVAWVPDEGRARLDELANRLDRISLVVFEDLGISARFGAEVVSTASTRRTLANDLALLGLLALALGAAVALATLWDRHRHEERHRERHRRLFGHPSRSTGTGSMAARSAHEHEHEHGHRWSSLFARHVQDHYPEPDDLDEDDLEAGDELGRRHDADDPDGRVTPAQGSPAP